MVEMVFGRATQHVLVSEANSRDEAQNSEIDDQIIK